MKKFALTTGVLLAALALVPFIKGFKSNKGLL